MYTQEEYLYGWLFYLVGVAIVMACGWVLTSFIKSKDARHLLRVIAGVIFIVPWYVSEDASYLAPAWIIAGFEGLVDGTEAFWRAGGPLCIVLVVAIIVSTGLQIYSRIKSR